MKISTKTDAQTHDPILTIDATQRPVTAHVCWTAGQLEGEGSSVGCQVRVTGCDVDGVGIRPLAHFHLRGEHVRCVVINVQQVHLKGACPAGRWDTWIHGKKTCSTDNTQHIYCTQYS